MSSANTGEEGTYLLIFFHASKRQACIEARGRLHTVASHRTVFMMSRIDTFKDVDGHKRRVTHIT